MSPSRCAISHCLKYPVSLRSFDGASDNLARHTRLLLPPRSSRAYSSQHDDDPRLKDLGKQIYDDYATIREHYGTR